MPDIIKDFCPDAMKSKDGISAAGRAYDIYGDQIPTLKMALAVSTQDNKKRSPPESQDSYEDYRFFLHWEPSEGECMLDKENLCEEAFEVMRKARCKSFLSQTSPTKRLARDWLRKEKNFTDGWLIMTEQQQAGTTMGQQATV